MNYHLTVVGQYKRNKLSPLDERTSLYRARKRSRHPPPRPNGSPTTDPGGRRISREAGDAVLPAGSRSAAAGERASRSWQAVRSSRAVASRRAAGLAKQSSRAKEAGGRPMKAEQQTQKQSRTAEAAAAPEDAP
jgi:hypothetical protein